MIPISPELIAQVLPILKDAGNEAKSKAETISNDITAIAMNAKARSMAKKAKKLMPSNVDSTEMAMNSNLNDLRKGYFTGAGYTEALKTLRETQNQGNADIVRASSGMPGAAIAGITLNNKAFGDSYGAIIQNAMQGQQVYTKMANDSDISMINRKADLDMMKYSQATADARNLKQQAWSFATSAKEGEKAKTPENFDRLTSMLNRKKEQANDAKELTPLATSIPGVENNGLLTTTPMNSAPGMVPRMLPSLPMGGTPGVNNADPNELEDDPVSTTVYPENQTNAPSPLDDNFLDVYNKKKKAAGITTTY